MPGKKALCARSSLSSPIKMSDLRQCPYDPLHKIAPRKFAIHLVKCRRQHPDVKLVSCHFDTSHLVKEENLREHMKTCSGRNHLLQYKTTVNTMPVRGESKLPDPAENLIYNTGQPSYKKATGGRTLQDDSECWDDFAYKAYDPLENCKTKLQNSKTFIIPNANRFAGQMQAATGLKAELAPDDSVVLVDSVPEAQGCIMSLGPFFRSPFTDLTASMVNFQQYHKCGELEMASIDCLEAYGTVRGAKKCADLLADFQECAFMAKQIARFRAMRLERHRQGWNGERKGDEYYAPPPRVDAF
uniref:CHHC U11-48K-type domain-containing protein n=1 Tax=Anopheles minimus TaxID=112268 RepID=A0A182WGQ1_9DIPT